MISHLSSHHLYDPSRVKVWCLGEVIIIQPIAKFQSFHQSQTSIWSIHIPLPSLHPIIHPLFNPNPLYNPTITSISIVWHPLHITIAYISINPIFDHWWIDGESLFLFTPHTIPTSFPNPFEAYSLPSWSINWPITHSHHN